MCPLLKGERGGGDAVGTSSSQLRRHHMGRNRTEEMQGLLFFFLPFLLLFFFKENLKEWPEPITAVQGWTPLTPHPTTSRWRTQDLSPSGRQKALLPLWFFPGGSDNKESACSAGDWGLIPGLGRSPGEVNGNPLQYSRLANPMDRGATRATVHGVAKSGAWLSGQHFHFPFLSCSHRLRGNPLVQERRIPEEESRVWTEAGLESCFTSASSRSRRWSLQPWSSLWGCRNTLVKVFPLPVTQI